MPLLNIFGGKITTYRRLAEEAIAKLSGSLKIAPSWTAGATLPGGDFPVDGYETLVREIAVSCPGLSDAGARRLVRNYGTHSRAIVANAKRIEDLGQDFGAGLSEREVRYLVSNEWAITADDILWRRTKLGLRFDIESKRQLDAWLSKNVAAVA